MPVGDKLYCGLQWMSHISLWTKNSILVYTVREIEGGTFSVDAC